MYTFALMCLRWRHLCVCSTDGQTGDKFVVLVVLVVLLARLGLLRGRLEVHTSLASQTGRPDLAGQIQWT